MLEEQMMKCPSNRVCVEPTGFLFFHKYSVLYFNQLYAMWWQIEMEVRLKNVLL